MSYRGDELRRAGKEFRPGDIVSHASNRDVRMVVVKLSSPYEDEPRVLCSWVDLQHQRCVSQFAEFELYLEEREGWDGGCVGCGCDCGGMCRLCGRMD